MDETVGYCLCSGKVEGGADMPKVADVPVTCLADGGDLMSKRKVRVKNETEVAGVTDRLDSGSGIESKVRVVDFGELDGTSKDEEFSFCGIKGEQVSGHPA